MRVASVLLAATAVLLSPAVFQAQSSQPSGSVSVPRLINLSGVFRPADGQPHAPVETVTLSIYADQEGGTPLWQETQSVALDDAGRYALLLGATHAEGVPREVFASGEAQWLGMVFARVGEVEGPRVRITSVPYALRASDAETLGGRPASSYLLAPTGGASDGGAASAAAGQVEVATAAAVLPGTTNFLAKYVNSADVGNSAVFETGGAVGIGTTTPLDTFHVRFTNTNGGATGLAVQNLGNTATSFSGMLFYDQNGALGQFQGFNNVTHEYRINNIASTGGVFDGSINFMTGSTSRFFVATGGNIGIGTASPTSRLDVINVPGASTDVFATSFGSHPHFQTRVANGTPAAPTAVQAGNELGVFGAGGYGSTFFTGVQVGMATFASENWTDTAHGASLILATTPIGAADAAVAVGILANGNVGIGTPTQPSGEPTATDKLQVVGDIRVGTTGTNGCLKNFAGTGLVGTCASDLRFKKDITPFGATLGSLSALRPVHYFWRANEFPDRHFGDSAAYGLIAQEVEQILPELVVTGADGYKAVDYSKLPLLTIQAVKELKAQNDALRDRVEELKAENDSSKHRLAELERLVKTLLTTTSRR